MGRRSCTLVLGLLACLPGCGVDEAVGAPPLAGPLDEAFEVVMTAYCESLWQCNWPDADLVELRALAGSFAGCKELVYRTRQSAANHDLDLTIGEGRIRIAAAGVLDCVRAIRSCEPYALDGPSPCDTMLEGTVAEGERCHRSEECAGDAYCEAGDLQCPGVCRRRTPFGGRCSTGVECAVQRNAIPFCAPNQDKPGGTCGLVTIEPPAPLGARCALASDGAPIVPCARGLWCDFDFGTGAGVCRAPIAEGAPCNDLDVCDGNALCHGEPRACRAVRVVHEAGAACDPDALVWCDAVRHLSCVDARCAVVGDGRPGSVCDASEFYVGSCAPGFHCRAEPGERLGRCTALGAASDPCSDASQCLSGSCRSDRTCAAGYCAPY